jgi:hypothetical protein
MKIQNYPCTKGIELFYSRVTLVILLCFLKYNYQNNPTQFSKNIYVIGKKPPHPRSKGKRENDQEVI